MFHWCGSVLKKRPPSSERSTLALNQTLGAWGVEGPGPVGGSACSTPTLSLLVSVQSQGRAETRGRAALLAAAEL